MEKMYLIIIKCEKEEDSFPFSKGNTIKAFTDEKEAYGYFQGIIDFIWTNKNDGPDYWTNRDNDTDYLGRTYKKCMEQKVFTSTDWLEIACVEIKNGTKLSL